MQWCSLLYNHFYGLAADIHKVYAGGNRNRDSAVTLDACHGAAIDSIDSN